MGAGKIVDEQEVRRWFELGWTHQQMIDEYRRKYGIETTSGMWGNFRQRRGLPRRIVRNDDLIPWAMKPEHRQRGHVAMLRVEGRIRQGMPISPDQAQRHRAWLRKLRENDLVVHYDPDSEEGFVLVPREPGDTDLIRRPRRKTTRRRNADEPDRAARR